MEDNCLIIVKGGIVGAVGKMARFTGIKRVRLAFFVRDDRCVHRFFFCGPHDVEGVDVVSDRVKLCGWTIVRLRLEVRASGANEKRGGVLFHCSRYQDVVDCGSSRAKGGSAVILRWRCFCILYWFGRTAGMTRVSSVH